MPEFDAEAAGILIENGVDVPTALAGSIVEQPRRSPPPPTGSKFMFWLAFAAGVLAVVAWRCLS